MPTPETHGRWMQLGTTAWNNLDSLQDSNKSVIKSAIRHAWGIRKWKNLPPQLILTLYKIPTVKSGPKYCLEVRSLGVSRRIYVSYQRSFQRKKNQEQRLYEALQSLERALAGQENRASRSWLKVWHETLGHSWSHSFTSSIGRADYGVPGLSIVARLVDFDQPGPRYA